MENKYNEKEPLVTVKNLEVCYTSGKEVVRAVNNVSFRIMESETLGLVGETGAGKTTIAKSIDRKSTRLNSSHITRYRMPCSA